MNPTYGAHTLTGRRAVRRAAALALLVPLVLGMRSVVASPAAPAVRSVALTGTPQDVALDSRTGYAFVLNDDATVGVVDLARARLVRTLGRTGVGMFPSMALDARTGRLVVVDPGNGLAPSLVRLWDSRSGALLASVRVGRGAIAMAVEERGNQLFVANAGSGTVSVLDAASGRPLHTVRLGAPPVALAVDARASRVVVLEQGALHGAAPGPNGYMPGLSRVGLLDARRGTLLRTVTVGMGPSTLAVDTRCGRVFVANRGEGTLSLLDAASGALLRTVAVGRFPTALAVDERRGLVYVVNAGEGTLSLLDARTGALRRTLRVVDRANGLFAVPPYALAVDEARDRLYLSTWGAQESVDGALRGPGTLDVLDARTGALLRRLTVGVAPLAVAVEPRSGRVVVLDEGGAVRASDDWLASWLRQLGTWLPWLRQSAPAPSSRVVPGSVSVLDAQD